MPLLLLFQLLQVGLHKPICSLVPAAFMCSSSCHKAPVSHIPEKLPKLPMPELRARSREAILQDLSGDPCVWCGQLPCHSAVQMCAIIAKTNVHFLGNVRLLCSLCGASWRRF